MIWDFDVTSAGAIAAALLIWIGCWLALVFAAGRREERRAPLSTLALKVCPYCKTGPDPRGFCCMKGQRGGAWQSDERWHPWSSRP